MPDNSHAARMKRQEKRLLDQAGSLLLIGWLGSKVNEILWLLEEFRPAGFIYFRRNWPEGLEELKESIGEVNLRARKILKRPLLWAVDQEGGTVKRFDDEGLTLPSASEIGQLLLEKGHEEVEELTRGVGLKLKEIGFNLNLAPVLDVRSSSSYIASRSFSHDPTLASEVAISYYRGFQKAGILTCGKHFPGLGSSVVDPHKDLPLVDDTVQVLWDRDGVPFRELIREEIPAIMTTHAIYRHLDSALPATFSPKVLRLLRQEYAFKGLAIADDLEMEGIRTLSSTEEAAVEAIRAGHDLAIVSKEPDRIRAARDNLVKAIDSAHIPPKRLQEALRRLRKALKQLV